MGKGDGAVGDPPLEHLGGQRYRVQLPAQNYRSLFARRRLAEVAMIIQRAPGWVLLQTKAHYPPGTFRLPTGTLKAGEELEEAMIRELREESNLVPGRYSPLCRVDYDVERGRSDFYTQAYLIEKPIGELKPNDIAEGISAWREARVSELSTVVRDLRRLEPPWRGWGLFRSVLHRLVGSMLQETGG